jgi:hypothetical protein
VKVTTSKARRSSACGGQPAKVAAARVAVSAAMPRQPHAVPAAPQRRHHLDSVAQLPAARTAHVLSTPVPCAAGAAPGAGAAAAAKGMPAAQPLVSNCSSSLMLPAAAQMRLLQLQQHHGPAAPANTSRFHPSVSAANARVPHVLNPGQMPPPRTSHTGACLPNPAQGLANLSLSPRGMMPGWTGAGAAAGTPARPQGGAEQGAMAAAAQAAAEATAAAARAAAGVNSAAALNSLCPSTGAAAAPGAPSLEILPVNIPSLLSDAESWELAQSQPWLIQAVAAEARQLLLGSAVSAVARASPSGAVGASAATAAALAQGVQVTGMPAAVGKQAVVPAGAARAGAGAGHSCSGVRGPAVAGADLAAVAAPNKQQRQPLGGRVLQARNV